MTENDYVIEVQPGVATVEAGEWDALLLAQAHPTPFMRHAYLLALEASGSVGGDTGWEPATLTVRLRDGGTLVAAASAYLKSHSYGEYVLLCIMTPTVQVGTEPWNSSSRPRSRRPLQR